jgi:hypothetical protein
MDILYIIKAGDAIKIGITSNFNSRIKSIQTGNPNKIIVLKTYYEDRKNIEYLERKLHSINNHIRLNGEWFKFYDDIENDIHKIILSEYPKIEFKIHDIDENFIPKKLNFQIPKPFEIIKTEIIKKPIVKKIYYNKKLFYDFYRYNKNRNYDDINDEYYKSWSIKKSIKQNKPKKLSFYQKIIRKYKPKNIIKLNPDFQNKRDFVFLEYTPKRYYQKYNINTKAVKKDCPSK